VGVRRPLGQPRHYRAPVTTAGYRLLTATSDTFGGIQRLENHLAAHCCTLSGKQTSLEADKSHRLGGIDHIPFGCSGGGVKPGGQINRKDWSWCTVTPAYQGGKGFAGRAGHTGTEHGINNQACTGKQIIQRWRAESLEVKNIDTVRQGLLPGFTGVAGQFVDWRNRNTADVQTVPFRTCRDQITITTVIARTAQDQHRAAVRPVPYQTAKSSVGSRLHKLKTINALLINHIAIDLPHRIGGKQCVW
jgi:hypothetical protein